MNPLKRSFFRGFIFLVVLSILDVATTTWALALGAQELNPLAEFLIHHGWFIPRGALGLVVPLKALVLLIGLWRVMSKDEYKVGEVSGVWWVCGLYSLAVVLNFYHVAILL